MNRSSCVIHVVAHCEDCKWENQDYIKGQKKAYGHARRTGHHVIVEIGRLTEYNSKEKPCSKKMSYNDVNTNSAGKKRRPSDAVGGTSHADAYITGIPSPPPISFWNEIIADVNKDIREVMLVPKEMLGSQQIKYIDELRETWRLYYERDKKKGLV